MGDWHTKPFAERKKRMGKDAESWFRKWADLDGILYQRLGFDNPPFEYFSSIPAIMRYAPDYHVEKGREHFLVECKGTGRRGVVKIKLEQLHSLQKWEEFSGQRVEFFIYDSSTGLISTSNSLAKVLEVSETSEIGQFDDWGTLKPYFALPNTSFNWFKLPERTKLEGK